MIFTFLNINGFISTAEMMCPNRVSCLTRGRWNGRLIGAFAGRVSYLNLFLGRGCLTAKLACIDAVDPRSFDLSTRDPVGSDISVDETK